MSDSKGKKKGQSGQKKDPSNKKKDGNWESAGRCSECNLLLTPDIFIYILTDAVTGEEKVVCQRCTRHNYTKPDITK